jgi:hypothetical protein
MFIFILVLSSSFPAFKILKMVTIHTHLFHYWWDMDTAVVWQKLALQEVWCPYRNSQLLLVSFHLVKTIVACINTNAYHISCLQLILMRLVWFA